MEYLVGIWAIVVGIVVFNGFAAGAVAALHVWRRKQSRGSKALTAAVISGMTPVTVLAPAMFGATSIGTASAFSAGVGLVLVGALTMAASLPGALIIARKLEGPGEAYRTFE